MSCRAQIVKREALLWSGAASPLPFGWCCGFLLLCGGVDFPSFLGVALLYWSSSFGVVLLSNFLLSGGVAFPVPFWVVSRFPPPLGWCWRFLPILGGVAFSSFINFVVRRFSPPPLGWCCFHLLHYYEWCGGFLLLLLWVVLISSLPHDSTILFSVLHWYIAHMTWHV